MLAVLVEIEMKKRGVSATEFKARCLAFLDEMDQRGGSVTITKRGRPVAVLSPAKKSAWKSPRNSWAGRGKIIGDIVNYDTTDLWEALK